MFYIDPRAGSNRLFQDFEGEFEEMVLEGGDVAFFGNGPEGAQWFFGIEYKKLDDMVQCIKDGRFSAIQLPEMWKLYDVMFLLVEGRYEPNFNSGDTPRLFTPFTGGRGTLYNLGYPSFDNYLTSLQVMTSLAGKPLVVKRANTHKESVQILRDIYALYQKPWDEHRSLDRVSSVKINNIPATADVLRIEPGDPLYPKYILRMCLFQIHRLGWETAGLLAETFGSMEALLAATQKELMVDGVGPTIAKRIYEVLHGHADPTIPPKRTRSRKDGA